MAAGAGRVGAKNELLRFLLPIEMSHPKYIVKDGIISLRPELSRRASVQLAIVSSPDEVQEAANAMQEATGETIQIPAHICHFIDELREKCSRGDDDLLEDITGVFVANEIPLGLIKKLFSLDGHRLHFIVDDSGSMSSQTDVDTSPFMHEGLNRGDMNTFATRWEEAQSRLHIMVNLMAYITISSITISFMNASNIINLCTTGKKPSAFAAEAHAVIRQVFSEILISSSEDKRSALAGTVFKSTALGETPTLHVLQRSLEEAACHACPTSHYLLTDGMPTDCTISQLQDLIKCRQNPEKNPITLLSCTNVDEECRWMKEVAEVAPFAAEIDDYLDELTEVMRFQGPAFPYTKGMWLVSNLVAALNPNDLDAMDQTLPLSRFSLQELIGRTLSSQEYRLYFQSHPCAAMYEDLYMNLLHDLRPAADIIPVERRELREKGKCAVM